MKHWLFLFLSTGFAWAADVAKPLVGGGLPLRLEDVLTSVERSYPPLLAALQERAIADGELLGAQGKFDLSFKYRTDSDSFGFYSNQRFDALLEQPLGFQGMSLYGGWRLGDGTFAPYDGKLETRSAGEFRSGLRLPILRDRQIDQRRADVQKARVGQRLADLTIDQQKLAIVQTATRRYWDWVAAGRRLALTQAVLDIATTRDRILRDGVQLGQLAAIEVTDNNRAILQRRSQVIEALRGLQAAAIELSLFYRNSNGDPRLPQPDQIPASFPAARVIPVDDVRSDVDLALRQRPDVQRLDAQRQQAKIDIDLARNQRAPLVDLLAGFASDNGRGPVKRGPNEFKASLVFELPFQRRTATGKLKVAEAKTAQIDIRTQFQKDQIEAEVRDAWSAVEASRQRMQLLREEVEVTRQLEDAERTRYDLGDSTLFILNQREQATAEAATREISAQADYQRALAAYDYAVAATLRNNPVTP